ncbi:MAG: hypothetical protein ACK5AZ_02250 [Bryobacteraceae bacterium]
MPYCCHCGYRVQESDVYCGHCGANQRPQARPDFLGGISPRTASVLCYIPLLGWIAAIAVLASERYREQYDVRLNAFQGLYLFVAWLIVDWVVAPFFHMAPGQRLPVGILKTLLFGAWIFMIIKTSQGHLYRLPVLGELAERSMSGEPAQRR